VAKPVAGATGPRSGSVDGADTRAAAAGTACARRGLDVLRERGVDRALVTCDDDNLASSRRTVEACGGVLEDVRRGGDSALRRYWIGTAIS
jgi:predicted acetyltransferase